MSAALTALLIGIAPLNAALAGPLRLDSSGLDCPNHSEIEQLIRLRVGPWPEEAQPEVSVVVESRPPAQLIVRLQTRDARTERVISFTPASDCTQVPRTVALLVRSWLNRRWTQPGAQPSPEAVPDRGPPPTVVAAADDGDESTRTPAPPRPISLLVEAGLSAQPSDGRRTPLVVAGVDREMGPRWGLGLEARYEAVLRKPFDPGQTGVAVWSLTPLARFRPLRLESARLDLFAGPGVSLLVESGDGYSEDRGRRFWDASVLAGACWRQRIGDSFWASASLEMHLRATRETISVDYLGPSMTLPRLRLSALIGFAWEPF